MFKQTDISMDAREYKLTRNVKMFRVFEWCLCVLFLLVSWIQVYNFIKEKERKKKQIISPLLGGGELLILLYEGNLI